MSALMWLRNDLRVDDNSALFNALQNHERVAAVYYATPEQWAEHDMAAVRGEFIWRTLEQLRQSLATLNVPLHVRVVPRFDDIDADLIGFLDELQCAAVFANREYAVNELRRDERIRKKLADRHIEWHAYHDATLLPPGSVRTQQGQPFKVFTPFKRTLIDLIGEGVIGCVNVTRVAKRWHDAPPLPNYPYRRSAIAAEQWPAGEDAAQLRLKKFAEHDLDAYQQMRDLPAIDATSQLSPYLALGAISVRGCAEVALAHNSGQWQGGNEGASTWLNELLWREFYTHLLAQFPRVSMQRAMRPDTEFIAWRDDDRDFQAWCEGNTGFPLVDAAMRQLVQTGWMHNRLRMITAMFLCKYLLLDWRRGERFFMQHLIDGDLAANNGGWQWSASTGTDAVPYFRLLNPVRQMERFDPDAQFCKQFLPQLKTLDSKILLQPGHPQLLQAGYPAPIVDLKFARERALNAFKSRVLSSGGPA